jgi:hypothetical protein
LEDKGIGISSQFAIQLSKTEGPSRWKPTTGCPEKGWEDYVSAGKSQTKKTTISR